MTKKAKQPRPTPAGAVELDESAIDRVAGGRKAGEQQQPPPGFKFSPS